MYRYLYQTIVVTILMYAHDVVRTPFAGSRTEPSNSCFWKKNSILFDSKIQIFFWLLTSRYQQFFFKSLFMNIPVSDKFHEKHRPETFTNFLNFLHMIQKYRYFFQMYRYFLRLLLTFITSHFSHVLWLRKSRMRAQFVHVFKGHNPVKFQEIMSIRFGGIALVIRAREVKEHQKSAKKIGFELAVFTSYFSHVLCLWTRRMRAHSVGTFKDYNPVKFKVIILIIFCAMSLSVRPCQVTYD